MTQERRCLTPACGAILPETGPRTRRLYCAACRRDRAADARERFKQGAPTATRVEGLQRRATLVWVCETLAQVSCAFCPERRIAALQLYRPRAADDELSIAEMIARGMSLARIQAAAKDAIVICASCYAVRLAAATESYRHQYEQDVAAGRPPLLTYVGPRARRGRGRPAAPIGMLTAPPGPPALAKPTETFDVKLIIPPQPTPQPAAAPPAGPRLKPRPPWARPPASADERPGVGIPSSAPVVHESRDEPVVTTEVIARPLTTDVMPDDDRTDETTPEQPTDGAAEVDVRDVSAAMAVGEPVREDSSGGRMDNTVDAGGEASVVPSRLDLGVRRRRH